MFMFYKATTLATRHKCRAAINEVPQSQHLRCCLSNKTLIILFYSLAKGIIIGGLNVKNHHINL